ncbi:MAG: DNA internalization-related competence protein ComEC/Rec2 [Burkholderiales bacterium]|nr:DNA internalization-related competence protein ComEC/Rec2 [Burkholderiales bacterium]
MIRLALLLFALGAAWLQSEPALPARPGLWLLLALLPLVVLLLQRRPGWSRRVAVGVLALGVGYHYAAWRAELRLADRLDAVWEGRELTLVGRVYDLPQVTAQGWRLRLRVQAVEPVAARVPSQVLLTHMARAGRTWARPAAGACVQLRARLAIPHAPYNPGLFDYEAWLLEQGLRATGHVTAAPVEAEGCGGAWRAWLDGQRERIRTRLIAALADRPYAGVVVALAIGDQDAIPDAQWTLFRHTGVIHLMSISGLHVTIFSALVYALVQFAWRRAPRLCLWWPARKAGLALGLAAAAAYVALAGFGIPAQRTLYMLAVVVAGLWAGWPLSPGRILAAALGVVVAIDPWAALAAGFWLSFGAVAVLMYAEYGRLRPAPWGWAWARAQWAIALALTPPLLVLFGEVSLIAPLANAFAIPLVSLVAVPLVLLAALVPLEGLAGGAHAVIALTVQGLEWLDRLPHAVWSAARPSASAIGLALLGAALLLLPKGVPARALGALLFLPLVFPRLERPPPGGFWLQALDVGQGLAVVVRTAAHTLVYDTGPLYSSGADAGARVLVPSLRAQGVTRLDALVVSHDDTDHSGGALSLAAAYAPGVTLTPLAGRPPSSAHGQAIRGRLPAARPCAFGQHWAWDGVTFQVLHPPPHHYANPYYADNERSCVLRVQGRHGSVLLVGDIERLGELSLLERVPDSLASEVLVVGHHGSRSSSMPAFLDAVAPAFAVISVGHRNRFGHPHPEVIERLMARGVRILRTDRDGALRLRFTPAGVRIERARWDERRYWHAPAAAPP